MLEIIRKVDHFWKTNPGRFINTQMKNSCNYIGFVLFLRFPSTILVEMKCHELNMDTDVIGYSTNAVEVSGIRKDGFHCWNRRISGEFEAIVYIENFINKHGN